jgi:hypothetical protein
MAAKHNCMAAPDEAFAHGEQVTGASSGRGTTSTRRAPYHYGGGTAKTPSRCTSRTIAASRSCGALSRGKAIQSLLVHRYNSILMQAHRINAVALHPGALQSIVIYIFHEEAVMAKAISK